MEQNADSDVPTGTEYRRDLKLVLSHVLRDGNYGPRDGAKCAIVRQACAGDGDAVARVIAWVTFVTEWRAELATRVEVDVFDAAMRLDAALRTRGYSISSPNKLAV